MIVYAAFLLAGLWRLRQINQVRHRTRVALITAYALIAYLLLRTVPAAAETGRDVGEALGGDLSTSAIIWSLSLCALGLWVGAVVLNHRIRIASEARNGFVLVAALCGVYAASALFSPARLLSLFYIAELAIALSALALSISGDRGLQKAEQIVGTWLLLYIGLAGSTTRLLAEGSPPRMPSFAAIAAVSLLYHSTNLRLNRTSRMSTFAKAALAASALVYLQSVAAFVALTTGGVIVLFAALFKRRVLALLLLVSPLTAALLVAFPGLRHNLIGFVADIFGRTDSAVTGMTGRATLWSRIAQEIDPGPIGLGLGYERLATIEIAGVASMWRPTSAHNGFISAWISGGIPALILTAALTGLVLARGARSTAHDGGRYLGCTVVLLVANFSNSLFPAIFSPAWAVFFALVLTTNSRDRPPFGAEAGEQEVDSLSSRPPIRRAGLAESQGLAQRTRDTGVLPSK